MQTIDKEDLGWVKDGDTHILELGSYSIHYDAKYGTAYLFSGGAQGDKLYLEGDNTDERKHFAVEQAYGILKNKLNAFAAKSIRLGVRLPGWV